MKERDTILAKISAILMIIFIAIVSTTGRTAADGSLIVSMATFKDGTVNIVACKGISIAAQTGAFELLKSEVCSNFAQIISGTQTTSQIGTDIQNAYADMQKNFSLTPFCAASLMGVFAQRIVNGKISAGSCPAAS
jgi:hypothetical protein